MAKGPKPQRLSRRFWPKVDFDGPLVNEAIGRCWMWTGSLKHNGYGQVFDGKSPKRAHRVAWELSYGPVPKDSCVLHRCDTRACVRPDHLFIGTAQDNTADMLDKNRQQFRARLTHCRNGHPFDEANTRMSKDRRGRLFQQCRSCERARREQRREYLRAYIKEWRRKKHHG